jgi:hypothetical protein
MGSEYTATSLQLEIYISIFSVSLTVIELSKYILLHPVLFFVHQLMQLQFTSFLQQFLELPMFSLKLFGLFLNLLFE